MAIPKSFMKMLDKEMELCKEAREKRDFWVNRCARVETSLGNLLAEHTRLQQLESTKRKARVVPKVPPRRFSGN